MGFQAPHDFKVGALCGDNFDNLEFRQGGQTIHILSVLDL